MSCKAIDYAGALASLDELLLSRFPGIDRSAPAECDRKLVEEGKLTESELLQIYAQVCCEDVKKFLQTVVTEDRMCLAVITPKEET